MAVEEHVQIARQGKDAIEGWRKVNPGEALDLRGADLSWASFEWANLGGALLANAQLHKARLREANLRWAQLSAADLTWTDLRGADFSFANVRGAHFEYANLNSGNLTVADLSGADLGQSILQGATLKKARLNGANFRSSDLSKADLGEADLREANLCQANLSEAHLRDANLREANLCQANLSGADLGGANLSGANLSEADLRQADLRKATIQGANLERTIWLHTALSLSQIAKCNVGSATHHGPSFLLGGGLAALAGVIDADMMTFLRGCGLAEWEVEQAKLHRSELTHLEIDNILYRVHELRYKDLGGVFLSYSHKDEAFANRIYGQLYHEGATVWRDDRDLVAGPMSNQFKRAIQQRDSMVLILSEASVESDWVELELKWAREKEKGSSRERALIFCIALDNMWASKMDEPLWNAVLTKQHVLDFSEWQDNDRFDDQFKKLIKGLRLYA